jgi:Zn-dependent protease with chaperone function
MGMAYAFRSLMSSLRDCYPLSFKNPARWVALFWLLFASGIAHCQLYSVDVIARDHSNENARQYFQNVLDDFVRLDAVAATHATLYLSPKLDVNAFATVVNGKPIVVIYMGLLRVMRNDREAVAAVLAHELGHLKRQHMAKGQQTNAAIRFIGGIVGLALDVNSARNGHGNVVGLGRIAGDVGATVALRAYSRDQEREADYESVHIMLAAGMNPMGAWRMQLALQQLQGNETPSFFATHPTSAERVKNLRAEIALTAKDRVRVAVDAPRASTPTSGDAIVRNPARKGVAGRGGASTQNPWEDAPESQNALLPNPWESEGPRAKGPFERP